jgi:hypothetical protein
MTPNDELLIPAFLRATGPVKKVRAPRWKKMAKVEKPTAERYEDAERYEVFIESTETFLRKIACGLRRVWVAEDETGARKVWLHDGETEQSLPMSEWQRMSNKARRIA